MYSKYSCTFYTNYCQLNYWFDFLLNQIFCQQQIGNHRHVPTKFPINMFSSVAATQSALRKHRSTLRFVQPNINPDTAKCQSGRSQISIGTQPSVNRDAAKNQSGRSQLSIGMQPSINRDAGQVSIFMNISIKNFYY